MTDDEKKAAGEAAYTRAMLLHGAGKKEESMAALDQSLAVGYPPAMLTAGSVHYQSGQQDRGRELLFTLTSLPAETENLFEILEEAGAFLISTNEMMDALELYRKAANKFPDVPGF